MVREISPWNSTRKTLEPVSSVELHGAVGIMPIRLFAPVDLIKEQTVNDFRPHDRKDVENEVKVQPDNDPKEVVNSSATSSASSLETDSSGSGPPIIPEQMHPSLSLGLQVNPVIVEKDPNSSSPLS